MKGLLRGWQELLAPQGRIPALDGLRALAILLVVCTHTAVDYLGAGGLPNRLTRFPLIQGGWAGVDLFFILSGFLIGRQLIAEVRETGSVRITRFILRRGLRIWPLYYTVLALGLVLALLGGSGADPWPELLFVSNYLGESIVLGSWSLSTEEQFYLVAPVLFYLGCKVTPSFGRRLGPVLVLALLVEPLIRAGVWNVHLGRGLASLSTELKMIYTPSYTHCDGLIAGLVLAHLHASGHFERAKSVWKDAWTLIALFALAAGLRELHRIAFNYFGLALAFGGVTWFSLRNPASWLPRLLGWPGFRVLSKLSFGVYLWYRFPLPWLSHRLVPALQGQAPELQYLVLLSTVLVLSAGFALVTYLAVEQPFLRYRERLSE